MPLAIALPASALAQDRSRVRVRAVVLERGAVFDSTEAQFWPYRLANALHVETRASVIRRELLIDVGDPWDSLLVAESERNLRALGIFRHAQIERQDTDSGIVMIVRTADAWTTTLGVGVATSGSQSVIDLSLQEANLLGMRTVARFGYRNDPDRSSLLLGFDMPRVIDNRIGLGVSLVERSDGRGGTVSMRLPFLSLSSRTGGSLSASVVEGRVLQFSGPVIVDSLWRESALLRADAAYAVAASPRGFLRVGVVGQVLRDDMVALEDRDFIPRTRTATAGPYVALRAPRFIRMHNVERIGRVEDFDLGFFATATLLAAPAAWGYDRNGIGGSLGMGIGVPLPGGFARFGVRGSILETAAGTDTASVDAAATTVLQRGERHLTVLHASAGLQHDVVPGREFDIGLGAGLRAYPAHAFTGDRFVLLAGEYRYLVLPRFLGLIGVGVAAYAGHAGAWNLGEPRRTGTEFGLGLRLASIREAGGIWRIDLSRRNAGAGFRGGWVASLGRGFVFGGV
ncbi:MAG TPA: hypothetical protein VFZ73_14665 [Gemmatimonadaceae bacterium]